MQKQKVMISNEEGLHARPAADFCSQASRFKSDIMLIKDGEAFDGKSILLVLAMEACKGDEVEITAEGEDEEEALEALVQLIEQE